MISHSILPFAQVSLFNSIWVKLFDVSLPLLGKSTEEQHQSMVKWIKRLQLKR